MSARLHRTPRDLGCPPIPPDPTESTHSCVCHSNYFDHCLHGFLIFVSAVACRGAVATGPAPFELDWSASAFAAADSESFTLAVRIYDVQRAGERGGVSVSFPLPMEADNSGDKYSSEAADVEAINCTAGLSHVTFHQAGATIYHQDNNRTFPPVGGDGRSDVAPI